MMSDNKDNQVATTSKEIREGGSSVEAKMDEVMNVVDEEMRNTENNPEEEELMVSLDSRSLNRSRKKFQKRKLSQQLSTTPLKKRKIN
jgi:pyridoxal/pyridoxine/pyridoxamine kinase